MFQIATTVAKNLKFDCFFFRFLFYIYERTIITKCLKEIVIFDVFNPPYSPGQSRFQPQYYEPVMVKKNQFSYPASDLLNIARHSCCPLCGSPFLLVKLLKNSFKSFTFHPVYQVDELQELAVLAVHLLLGCLLSASCLYLLFGCLQHFPSGCLLFFFSLDFSFPPES